MSWMFELLLIASSGEGQRRPDVSPWTRRRGCANRCSGREQLAGDAAASNSQGTQRRDSAYGRRGRDAACKRRATDKAARLHADTARRVASSSPLRCGDAGGYMGPTDGNGVLTPNAKTTVLLILVPRVDTVSQLRIEKQFPHLFFSFFIRLLHLFFSFFVSLLAMSSNCLCSSFINTMETEHWNCAYRMYSYLPQKSVIYQSTQAVTV
jgi:hypothetical protein